MSLFFLPCDLLRAILQRISLQDIARLIIATNNKSNYETLQEAIDTLEYQPKYYHVLPEDFYDWARRVRIHLTLIRINNPSCAHIAYFHEMREFFIGVCMFRTDANNDKLYNKIPLLMESFPNLKYIISNRPLVFDDMTAQQGLQLKSITISNCTELAQLPNITRLRCISISLTTDDAEIIIGSCPNLKWMTTTLNNYDGLQYLLMHSSLIKLTINSNIPTTPPPYVPIPGVTGNNIITLKLTMNTFDTILIGIIADHCTELKTLEIEVITGYYTADCDTVIVKLLSKCKWLEKFSYQDNANNATMGKPATNMLYSLFNTGHRTLASISVHQGIVPITSVAFNAILTTPMPKLKKLYLDGSLPQPILMLLSGCSSLVHLDYDSTILDAKLLYNACPSLRSIRYTGPDGHKFFQHSHEHLELLTILGNLRDTFMGTNSAFTDFSFTSFPSLKQLEIKGNLDPNSWTRIMMSTNMKGVHKLVLSDTTIIAQINHSIIDTILHHPNFSGLRLVCCAKDVTKELRVLVKWSSRDIIVSHYTIFTE